MENIFFTLQTGESRWTRPEEAATQNHISSTVHLPPGWHTSEHEGEVFYWHDDGESTSWEVPDWIPDGWVPPESFFQDPHYERAADIHQPTSLQQAAETNNPGHKRGHTTQIVTLMAMSGSSQKPTEH